MIPLIKKTKNDTPRRRQRTENDQPVQSDNLHAFRRNRTLTGSTSASIASANEIKSELKSPRAQAHDLVKKRRHVGGLFVLALICAGGLFMILSQFTARAIVHTSDVSMRLDATYADTIQEYLASRPVERLRFLLNDADLSAYVQARVPEVENIQVKGSSGFGETEFLITMRRPIAGWTVKNAQQFVDATGTAFTRNYYSQPKVQIIDKTGVNVEAGKAVASNRFLGFVGRAVGLAKDSGYTVTSVVIPEQTTRQIQLHLKDVSCYVKLSVDRGVGEQIEDMARSIKWLQEHNNSPEYVDVRVSGKAFYK